MLQDGTDIKDSMGEVRGSMWIPSGNLFIISCC